MAKRKPSKVEETQEMAVVVVVPEPVQLPPDSELCFLINEDTGETRQVVARAGYAPAPMPFGFRLARAEEIADR